MSDIAIVDPTSAIEAAADPAEFVVVALERGKTWLTEALQHGDLDALVAAKGWAATLRTATMQKQLGKDAELAATELVRRAERCIGLGIRRGQEAGAIAKPGSIGSVPPPGGDPALASGGRRDNATSIARVTDFSSDSELRGSGSQPGIYALTDDVTDEQFEEAVEEAKAEKNLSRANLVRKVKGQPSTDRVKVARDLAASGHNTAQIAVRLGYSRRGMREFLKRHGIDVPADASVARTRNLDSTRIVRASVEAVDGIGIFFPQIDYAALDPEDVKGWLPILDESIRALTTLRNQLRKVSQP